MALSANGFPVLWAPPPAALVPGTAVKLRVRPGDVATVLIEVARRFHDEVESIELPVSARPGYDDWGWAVRPIRGRTVGYSNHAAGCALDFNATLHPRGVEGTFKRTQERKVRRILASTWDGPSVRNVVRWGRDYFSAPEDSMHFEINASPAAVNRVANRIRQKYAEPAKPKPAPQPVTDEEDDMKSDEELPLGQWGIDVLRDPDGKITAGQATVVQTVAAAQTNEFVHAMAKTMAAMQVTQLEILAELRKRPA